jgi:hypothetical protein
MIHGFFSVQHRYKRSHHFITLGLLCIFGSRFRYSLYHFFPLLFFAFAAVSAALLPFAGCVAALFAYRI